MKSVIICAIVIFVTIGTVTSTAIHSSISKRATFEVQAICLALRQLLSQVDNLVQTEVLRLDNITSTALNTINDLITSLGLNRTCVNLLIPQIDVLKSNALAEINKCKAAFIKSITDLLTSFGCNAIALPPLPGIDLTCLLTDLINCLLRLVNGILDGLLGDGGLLNFLLELLRNLLGTSLTQQLNNLISNPVNTLMKCVRDLLDRLQIDISALLIKVRACIP